MKKILIHSLSVLLLFTACQKEAPQEEKEPNIPTPEKPQPAPAPPVKEKTAEEQLLGEWRLLSIKDSNDPLDKELGECKHKSHQYTVNIQENKLTLKEGTQEDTYTYQIKGDILTLAYPFKQNDGNIITVTTSYKKNYEYNPKKELIGTWYIHSLKRAGYNYNDVLENGNCMTKEKIVFTTTDVKIYQYDLGSVKCKEVIYQGTYEISNDLTRIIVTSKRNGVKGYREFFLDNGTLEVFGYISNGDLEQKFYRKDKKYNDE